MSSEREKIWNEQCAGRILRGMPKDAELISIIQINTKDEIDKHKSIVLNKVR